MNRKQFLADEWAAAVKRMPELPGIAKEAKARFECEGAIVIFGKRKAEPETPKYVDPFQARTCNAD